MTDDATPPTAAVHLTVPAVLDEIGGVRRELTRAVIDAGDDRSVAHDIALAASELCTNVVQYASTDDYRVTCERHDDHWVLEVSHADDVDVHGPDQVSPSSRGGRGLMIVRALMDTVELVEVDDGTAIRCTTAVA